MKRFASLAIILGLTIGGWSLGGPPKSSPPSSPPSSGSKPSFGGGGSQPTPTPSKPSFGGGGSSSTPKPSTPTPPASPPSTPTPSKPQFSGGGQPPAGTQPNSSNKPSTPPSTGPPSKPQFSGGGQQPSQGSRPSGSIDQKGAKAQERIESKQAMKKAEAPAPQYTDAKGKTHDIDPKDKKIEQLRNQLDHEKWVNREQRERDFYRSYYSRPVVVYHDPYSSYYWWWMLDQSLEVRAMWAYNHRASMDAARYNDMMRDAALAARVAQLERDKARVDPSYTPPGIDPDLQYTDDYVNAAYNPQSTPSAALGYICVGVSIVLVVVFVVWLLFVKEWSK